MSKSNIIELSGREETGDPLTTLLRTGARTLIQRAVEAELVEFMSRFEGRTLRMVELRWCATAINLNVLFRPVLAR